VRKWFDRPDPRGLATISGRISGNLELLDFDHDADTIYPQWCALVEEEYPGLVGRLNVSTTPREPAGYHVRYRCTAATIPGNTALAVEPYTDAEGKAKRQVLIETRGKGGYAVCPGSPSAVHENKRPYIHHSGPPLDQLPDLTAEEREVLWVCARYLDRTAPETEKGSKATVDGLRPGDDYDLNGPDWAEILEPHGWRCEATVGAERRWCRPGKDGRAWSATTGHCRGKDGADLLRVFSSNAYPFDAGKAYGKFRAFVLLNHHGDLSAAAKDLAGQGYGKKGTASAKGRVPDPEPWELPPPLDDSVDVPEFPLDCLPAWLAEWARATATATQTPPDLAALLALAFAAAGLAGKFRVSVRDGWAEPLNLFVVVALLSGERKSAVFASALAPVQTFERQERERLAPTITQAASERRILESRLKNTENKAAKQTDDAERATLTQEARALAAELAGCVVPAEPRCFCDDETPENLSRLLALHGGRMLQASAEGTAFEIAKGRYSETANFDVYLKGHSGDPLRVGRVGRSGEVVDRPALSCALAVQPDVICGLAEEATMAGRGYLARWLYGVPPSMVGRRQIAAEAVPSDVNQTYHNTMLELWRLPFAADQQGRPAAAWLRFSPEADEVLREFEHWLEPQLAPGAELSYLSGWANKLAGAAARIAGVLHVAGRAPKPCGSRVEVETVRAAVRLARDYLLPHAQAAFAQMGADERLGKARKVWASLVRHSEYGEYSESAPPRFSRRDIHQWERRTFTAVEELDPILKLLMDWGYIRPWCDTSAQTGRGHKSPVFEVNPLALARSKNTDPRPHCTHCTHSEE
jgi:hypothetical protein